MVLRLYVKQGDTVKAGDVLAEMDLKFLEERKLNPITPVLICGGMEGKILVKSQPGQVEAGKSELLTVAAKPEEAKVQKAEGTEAEKNRRKPGSSIRAKAGKEKAVPSTLTFYRSWEKY